jgi:hypothetical protein
MIHRKTFPAYGNCDIALATEQMRDGNWAVVVTIAHTTDNVQRTTDLPVSHERFATETEAEEHGLRMAREWIDRNTPHAAPLA